MADKYACTLDEASLKKAKDELQEDPKERLSQVEALRTWILQQKHFTCPTETEYLLRFLRHCKFSQLRTREMVETFMKLRSEFPQWLCDADIAHKMVIHYIKEGPYVIMPKRDHLGRKVLLMKPGSYTPSAKIYDRDIVFRGMFGLNSFIMGDEDTMVNGVVMFIDMSGFAMKHHTFWGIDTMSKTTKMWQKLPGRMKGFHYYNIGPVVESLMAVMKPLLSKKFQERINIHGNNMESVYKHIPMEYLPREYLPDDYKGPCQGTMAEIIDQMVADIQRPEVRDRVLYETGSNWTYDATKKTNDVPSESFRKLNID